MARLPIPDRLSAASYDIVVICEWYLFNRTNFLDNIMLSYAVAMLYSAVYHDIVTSVTLLGRGLDRAQNRLLACHLHIFLINPPAPCLVPHKTFNVTHAVRGLHSY